MRVLITGSFQINELQIAKLQQLGARVDIHKDERSEVENPEIYDAVVCNGLFLYNKIENFINLKFVQLTSAGFDRVPMDYIKEHSITINNARGVYSIPMAEYALFGVLQLMKQGAFFLEKKKDHCWQKHRGLLELNGKTVCIIGCGSVGTECAKRFAAFGCRVIGVDLFPRVDLNYEAIVHLDELHTGLCEADVVVLTLPLTQDTYHMINAEAFSHMRSGAFLVNIARGAIVDTDALIEALKTKIAGAVLDVFEDEPLHFESPLWDMDNVLITPHNSFVGEHNSERLWNVIFHSLRDFMAEVKL